MKIYIFYYILITSLLFGQQAREKIYLSLDKAVETALAKNFEVLRAQNNVEALKGKFWNSISLPSPWISLSHDFVPIGKGLSDYQERTWEINQAIEFPTNIFLKGSRSNYEISASRDDLDKTMIETTSNVKKLYTEVLIRTKKLALFQDNLKIAKDFLEKADLKFKSGEGTKLEAITAKIQFNEASASLKSAQNDLKFSKNALLTQLNSIQISDSLIVLTDSLAITRINLKYEDLLQEAVANNSSLKRTDKQIEIASINKTLAWSSLLPNFNFSYYRQAEPDNPNLYGVSFGISLPIWFLFDQRGQIQEASANYNIALEENHSLKNSIPLELNNAYTGFIYEQEQLDTYRNELLPEAESVFGLAKLSYDSGEINYVEFLQAKQNLISIRNNYFNSLSNYFTVLSSLEKIIGRIIR